jgi:thymidylate kinase
MKRGKHIVFSGLDCSGKSTQIELLKNSFTESGQKNMVFWSRGGYTPGFQKLKDILRIFSGAKLPKPGHTPQREKALSNPVISRVWLSIAMIDLIFYYVFYLRFKCLIGYNIICDRYLLDTNIDFKLAYPQNKTDKWVLWRLLKFFALKPDFHFVSTVPVEESVIRSKFKFEPYPDSPETLSKRLELYNMELKNDEALIFIDGMRDLNEIKEQIHKIVSKSK